MIQVDQTYIDSFLKLAKLDLNVPGVAGDLLRRCVVDAIEKPSRPFFLPAPRPGGTVWYVLPRTPQQSRILRDQVKSFLSFPYSDYDGTRGNFDKADSLDQLITGAFGDLAIKIQAGTSAVEKASFNNALKRLLELLDEQPDRSLDLVRPLQRVRQDFEWALAAKDIEGSKRYLEELTANGRLSQENVWYLQIQRWASLELWNDIIQHPDLADLLCLRRPTKVTYAVLRAFSDVYLNNPNLNKTDLSQILNQEPLSGLRDIHLVVDDRLPADIALVYKATRELLSGTSVENDSISQEVEISGFELARNLYEVGQLVDALEILKDCPDDGKKLSLVLRICREIPSPNLISIAVDLRNGLPSGSIDTLLQNKEIAELLQWLSEQTLDDQVPPSLIDWLRAFQEDFTDALLESVFREQSESWNIDLLTKKDATEISQLMEAIFGSPRSNLLVQMLPALYDLVANLDANVRAPILRSCFFILAIQDQLTPAELGALHHVLDTLFDIVNEDERSEILNEVLNIWTRVAKPRQMAWFLDIAASIKATAGPNDAQSRDIIVQMASVVVGFMPGSLEESYRVPANVILSGVYEIDAWVSIWQAITSDNKVVQDPFAVLATKSVGIYCLEQARAMRMSAALGALSSCSITLNHHYAGTEALENLAKSSDLMIVITSAAKHAATECIRVNRGDKPIIYIHSTGVSTFLRSVEAFLSQQA
jgi:hypothetical protein